MDKLTRLSTDYAKKETQDPAEQQKLIRAYRAGYLRHVIAWVNRER